MKWVVFGGKDQEVRFRCLSEYLTSTGNPNELEFLLPTKDDFLMQLERTIQTVDQIRLQSPFGELTREFQNRTTEMVNLIGTADSLVKKSDGSWWPENYLFDAFIHEFIKHVTEIDLNSHALIVGSGSASKVLIAALVKSGFSKIHIADRFEERAKKTITMLNRNFFNVEFDYISPSSVMLLPGSSSVLVNATPIVPDNELLKDLYYFNFLKHPSVIIDLNLIPPESPLIEEGKSVGSQVICGYEIAAECDGLWAKDALKIAFDIPAYKEALKKKLSEVVFDSSPYKLS